MTIRGNISLTVIACIILAAYLGLWTYSAQWFQKEIDRVYADNGDNIEFLGDKPRIANFPFTPKVLYSGGLKIANAEIVFPQVQLKGYPLPGTALKIDFPLGVALGGVVDPALWNLDSLKAAITIPYHLPEDFTFEGLSEWRDKDGSITVRSYGLNKDTLHSTGKGHLLLDAQLQPDLAFESEIYGYQDFIAEQQRNGYIKPFAAAGATMLLNSLSAEDPKNGQSYVPIDVTVKNGILTAGPIQALELPPIVWGRRN